MDNVVPVKALSVGLLGVVMGLGILVWVRPLFTVDMYDQRLRQAGTRSQAAFLWFRMIGGAQRIAFILGGVLLLAAGLFAVGLYLLGFFGLNPLHIAP